VLIPKDKLKDYNLSTLDTLKIEIPSQNIIKSYSIKEGNYAIITGGKNVGIVGKIKSIQWAKYKRRVYSIVTLESSNATYQTNLINVMVLGENELDPNVGVKL